MPGHEGLNALVFEGRLPGLPQSCFTLRFEFDARRILAFPALDSIYSIGEPVRATVSAVLHESFHMFQRSAFSDTRGALPSWTFGVHEAGETLPDEVLHGAEFQRLAREERELLALALVAPIDSLQSLLDRYIRVRAARMRMLPERLRGVEPHEERKEGSAHYAGYVATFLQIDGHLDSLVPILQADLRAPLDFAASGGGQNGQWRSWHIYATGAALGAILDRLGCDWKPAVARGYTLVGVIARAIGSPESLDDVMTPVPESGARSCGSRVTPLRAR